jgi:hypothetical protein
VNFLLNFFFLKVNVISFENYTRLFLHIFLKGALDITNSGVCFFLCFL